MTVELVSSVSTNIEFVEKPAELSGLASHLVRAPSPILEVVSSIPLRGQAIDALITWKISSTLVTPT